MSGECQKDFVLTIARCMLPWCIEHDSQKRLTWR